MLKAEELNTAYLPSEDSKHAFMFREPQYTLTDSPKPLITTFIWCVLYTKLHLQQIQCLRTQNNHYQLQKFLFYDLEGSDVITTIALQNSP